MLQQYIHALADLFVNINKYQQAFLAPLLWNGHRIISKPSSPMYPFVLPFFCFYSSPMEQPTIQQLSTPKGEFLEPPPSSKPITASGYELSPGFIAMVREQTFSGLDYENPYHHLREFEQLCACLTISGMTQENLR